MDSMELMGQFVPILVRDGGEVVDGHRRLRAAQRLGWESLECHYKDLTLDEALAAMLRLNDLTVDQYRRGIICLISNLELDKLSSVGYVLGRNNDWVASILGLGTLSPLIRRATDKGWIHIKVAMLLAKLQKGRQRQLLTDSLEKPVSSLIPQLQDEVRHSLESKVDKRATKKSRADTPLLRTEKEVYGEVKVPTHAMRLLTKYDATTPLEGWNLALRWAVRLDNESIETRTGESKE